MSTTQNEVKFNDGEVLVLSDLHDMQRFLKSMVFDQGIGAHPRVGLAGSGFPDSTLAGFALTPHVGSAYPKGGAGTRQVTNTAGMVHQWISTSTPAGTDCNLLGYQLAADELAQTCAANASGNPRIDALCIKLSYDDSQDSQTRDFEDTTGVFSSQTTFKKRRTVLSVSLVTGTPAALPQPASTAAPAGYAVFAYIFVPSGYATTFTADHVWDNRMPMRVASIKSPVYSALLKTSYSRTTDGYTNKNETGTQGELYFPFPKGAECRILGANIYGHLNAIGAGGGSMTAVLRKLDLTGNPTMPAPVAVSSVAPANQPQWGASGGVTAVLGGTIYNQTYVPTVWGNGWPCGAWAYSFGDSHSSYNLIADITDRADIDPGNMYVNSVEWFFAY